MSVIVEKIKSYLDAKGIAISKAEAIIGVSNGTLSKPIKNNKAIKTDTFEKFLSHFDDFQFDIEKKDKTGKIFSFVNEEKDAVYRKDEKSLEEKIDLLNNVFGGGSYQSISNKLDLMIDNQVKILDRLDREIIKDMIEETEKKLKKAQSKG